MNQVAVKDDKPIKGVILKCVDGRWSDRDGLAPPPTLLVCGLERILQRFLERGVETITGRDKPLPDPDELNAKIPESEWRTGLSGKPEKPWKLNFVVRLLDPQTAEAFTFVNSTMGAQIAYERLSEQIENMTFLRGGNPLPIVKLDSRPMPTDFGSKLRPHFTVVEWRAFGPPAIEQTVAAQIEHQPAAAASSANNNDKPGKPVEPVSLAQELDDEIPF